jgi:hypothetical protein
MLRPIVSVVVIAAATMYMLGPASAQQGICKAFSGDKRIAARWRFLGGENGHLGCALGPQSKLSEGGYHVSFMWGSIVLSPNFGAKDLVVSGYYEWKQDQTGTSGAIHVSWFDMAPFHYDEFLVRWDRNGQNIGQDETNFGGSQGNWRIPIDQAGSYRIVIEGCDGHRSHSCKQGWTAPLYIEVLAPDPKKF